MKPLHHHLYQIIKRACEVYGKCTFARETFCRIVGYSPNSVNTLRYLVAMNSRLLDRAVKKTACASSPRAIEYLGSE